ncbi:MAG: M20 family metallopeptidase [Oscillospiraceae bacterium]|nr:M20 family metallopeptidase [Oscillospiraceae bacterium]
MEEMQKLIVEIASELIKTPGHNELDEYERNTALKMAELLRNHGVDCEISEAAEGRLNVTAKIKGGNGPRLLLTTHLDTVPPGGMADAYNPVVRDGYLYGRGAVDVKGPLASMAAVMIYLKKQNITPPGDVLFAGVAGEESGSVGMRALVRSSDLRPDIAVICEPTWLEVCAAHNGIIWAEVEFFGKAAHGSMPDAGINAVYKANDFIHLLREKLLPELAGRRHPLTGPSTLNIGFIQGGTRPTIVPASCVVRFDRRFIPGETRESVVHELTGQLEELRRNDPDFQYGLKVLLGGADEPLPPLDTPSGHPMIEKVCAAASRVLGKQLTVKGMPGWTDAALANAFWNVPAVIVGPGDMSKAHSDDECVELQQLFDAYRLYMDLALNIGKKEETDS